MREALKSEHGGGPAGKVSPRSCWTLHTHSGSTSDPSGMGLEAKSRPGKVTPYKPKCDTRA